MPKPYRGNRKILPPVHPNAGLTAAFRKKLDDAIADMNRSTIYWLKAQYRRNPSVLAQDASASMGMRDELSDLGRQWQTKFDTMAEELGREFAKKSVQRSDSAFKSILKKAGWTVEFKMTPAANEALQSSIGQNIALIKSIPEQYHTQVQGIALRSIASGGDLGMMTKEIEHQFGVTRKRAALIARTQNAMATATITRVRQTELGIDTAVWLHSHGGREPRPSHLANDGKTYTISKGWFDPDEQKFIWPGQLIPNGNRKWH